MVPTAILAALADAANEWRGLAVVWHALLAAFVTALVFGWRPSVGVVAGLLATPLMSVAVTAWWSGNPFNAIVFLLLAAELARAAFRLPADPVRLDSPASLARAGMVAGFGAVYPHFLHTDSWVAYAVASPFGVLPCPTLLVVIGMTLAIANLRPAVWGAPLLLAGVLYAAIGVFALGVALDWGLFVAAALLGAAMADAHVWRSGRADRAGRVRCAESRDELLDRFMPQYDVVERHRIRVAAPADVTLSAAAEQDLLRVPLIRAIFRAREIVMGAAAPKNAPSRGLLAMTQALGWGVLAQVPGREVVMGAVTRPWQADVTFRALPPGEFAAFAEPGFVKIVWTLRADPAGSNASVFRTETRAVATDEPARARFRRYWSWASPGIALIRWLSLRPLRREAERRASR